MRRVLSAEDLTLKELQEIKDQHHNIKPALRQKDGTDNTDAVGS